MSQGSHTRDKIRKELLPQFEALVDAVCEARQKDSSMEAEDNIAKLGDALSAMAIGQWLLLFDREDDVVNVNAQIYARRGTHMNTEDRKWWNW